MKFFTPTANICVITNHEELFTDFICAVCVDAFHDCIGTLARRPRYRAAHAQHQRSVFKSGFFSQAAAANFQSCGRRRFVVQGIRCRRKNTQGQRRAGARFVCQQRLHAHYGAGAGRCRRACVCAGHQRPRRIRHKGTYRLHRSIGI